MKDKLSFDKDLDLIISKMKEGHLHLVPRYKDEPFASRGIRHWIKSEENKRQYK